MLWKTNPAAFQREDYTEEGARDFEESPVSYFKSEVHMKTFYDSIKENLKNERDGGW